MIPPSSLAGAVVVDASALIAVTAREATGPRVDAELNRLGSLGYELFAPGVLLSEALFVLCRKLQNGILDAADHTRAVSEVATFLTVVSPPPNGESSLALRAEAIRGNYTCLRSADGIYIALAEALTAQRPTALITLDNEMRTQANKAAPSVTVIIP